MICVVVLIFCCDGSDKICSFWIFEIRLLLDVMVVFMMEKLEEYMCGKGWLGRGGLWFLFFIL